MPAPKKAYGPRYGWLPDLPDHRDMIYSAPYKMLKVLPPKVNLRPNCPPVYDQGQLGSCTANAIAGAIQFDELKQRSRTKFAPSRLFIYYNERAMEGTIGSDSGAQIRDGIKSVAKLGAPPETDWPYSDSGSRFIQKPDAKSYSDALKHRVLSYERLLRDLNQYRGCLASGYPFVFGFTVYESFESSLVARTGVAPMPSAGDKVVGGHAVMAVGYDDSQHRFIVRNSWGTGWGLRGYFTLPYAYFTDSNLSDDFWTIRVVA
ncbi:MAG TPA: C1 family peptidase [Candidatus Saccharimonadales bacterium]|nr:C1 family peptidase [Candidatus Saccharimonadales bacterium]